MWGGAMMFNDIVVQHDALPIVKELGIDYKNYSNNLYIIDSLQATSALIYHASKAGATLMNCISVEDVVIQDERVRGVVINWAPVHREKLHVDPIIVVSKAVLDATGHDCEVARILERKNGIKLNTPTGSVIGERSMSVYEAEKTTIENTKEIFPGLFVSGMAANGVSGSFRMGPIFGGMLLSGKKISEIITNSVLEHA
jgi:thiamine thiazole synthase